MAIRGLARAPIGARSTDFPGVAQKGPVDIAISFFETMK